MNDTPNAALRIYLIRHGETTWALTNRHTSRTDIPLTGQGEQDARRLGERLRVIRFDAVLTSPRQRARRTCTLAGLAPIDEVEPDLVEWDYGDYEGKRSIDIRKARPGWNLFRDGCPQGETPGQVSERADRLLTRLRALEGNVALFSHGQFACVLVARWIGLPVIEGQHFMLGTASVSILGYDPHHPEVSVIALLNASPHEMMDSVPHRLPGDIRTAKQRVIDRWENEGGEIPQEQSVGK